jgi:hypothetical protein|tara:strand:+ start:1960 stop:2262 length:303 start_codon:yes stop_codon:yes gene_type:complete
MKLRFLLIIISSLLILSSCETIKKKSDSVAKKENDKFGKFIGDHIEELKIELGNSTEDYLNEKGNKIFVYKSKKYGITCERKFEVDEKLIIIGFSSSGCI